MTWQSALEPLTGKVQRQQYDGAMGAGVPSALTACSRPGAAPAILVHIFKRASPLRADSIDSKLATNEADRIHRGCGGSSRN